MDELKLDPNVCKVKLFGELSHDSAIFSNLYKYIRHLSFGTKPVAISYSFKFDEVLDHRYFDLYNAYLANNWLYKYACNKSPAKTHYLLSGAAYEIYQKHIW